MGGEASSGQEEKYKRCGTKRVREGEEREEVGRHRTTIIRYML